MKHLIAVVTAIALILPASVMAGELIFGAKVGVHKADVSGFDPAPMASAQLSYEFLDLVAADLAFELEAGKTLSDGTLTDDGQKIDFSVTTVAAYLSARTAGPIYAIGRIGVAETTVDYEDGEKGDDSGLALGGGVGFSLGARTEVELTRYELDKEQAFYLSLGAAF